MNQVKKLILFLKNNNYKKEMLFLQKIARDSDDLYIKLIKNIINLFKNNSIEILSNNKDKLYRVDLRDLEFYDYTVLNITALGNYLDLIIYHPESEVGSQNFYCKFTPPGKYSNSTISFYPDWKIWDYLNNGNIIENLIRINIGDLRHEITHFLDNTRFLNPKGVLAVSNYGSQNTDGESFGYINSTEEVQARIMSLISFVMDSIFDETNSKNLHETYHQKWLPIYENKSGNKRENFIATLLYYVDNNDINSFVNEIFKESKTFYIKDKLLLETTKKRYLKRLYDLFIKIQNKLKNNEEIDNNQDIFYFENES